MPTSSTVLQGRRGYRDVYRHASRYRLSARWLPLDEIELAALLELKDIAKLYELWCFFRVADAVSARFGEPAPAEHTRSDDFEVITPSGLELGCAGGVSLVYGARVRP